MACTDASIERKLGAVVHAHGAGVRRERRSGDVVCHTSARQEHRLRIRPNDIRQRRHGHSAGAHARITGAAEPRRDNSTAFSRRRWRELSECKCSCERAGEPCKSALTVRVSRVGERRVTRTVTQQDHCASRSLCSWLTRPALPIDGAALCARVACAAAARGRCVCHCHCSRCAI